MKPAGLDRSCPLKIADIGCGTGASTLLLAKELDAEITAADFLPEFLEELQVRATAHGVAKKITTLSCSLESLPFSDGTIYNVGFEAGVSTWSRHLKAGGKLIVSEITWLWASRSPPLCCNALYINEIQHPPARLGHRECGCREIDLIPAESLQSRRSPGDNTAASPSALLRIDFR